MREMVPFILNCSDHLCIICEYLSLEWERIVYLKLKLSLSPFAIIFVASIKDYFSQYWPPRLT